MVLHLSSLSDDGSDWTKELFDLVSPHSDQQPQDDTIVGSMLKMPKN